MRALTVNETRELEQAFGVIFTGVVASQRLEGVVVPDDMELPPCELSPEDQFQLAVNLGIVRD